MRKIAFLIAAAAVGLASCGGPPCRTPDDCPFGYYCVLQISGSGMASGQCLQDCLSAEDCPQPGNNISRAICTNEGRCTSEARPPRLLVLEPEVDTSFAEGTREVRVSGEVESAAPNVTVTVSSRTQGGCFGGPARSAVVDNPTPGEFSTLPFVVDRVIVDPGLTTLIISAGMPGSRQTSQVLVEIPCPGCPAIRVEAPGQNASAAGLELSELSGTIAPGPARALWRVHSVAGDVFDGSVIVTNGRFSVERLPLFAGTNRVEVVVTGVGGGVGEARCSTSVVSSVAREKGLRAVMSWDGETSDLDLHLIGPGGVFGDPMNSLAGRSQNPVFGGQVVDDFDGLGPEILTVEALPDGVFGVVVEPVSDASDPGSNTFLRLLVDGRTLTSGPIGPRYLSARRSDLWVVGTLTVSGGTAEFSLVDEVVPASAPPTRDPRDWPMLY